MKCRPIVSIGKCLVTTLALVGVAGLSEAQIVTLADGNSVVQINTGSQAGMFNWSVDGVNQLSQQQFWYRIGPAGGESTINTLSAPTIVTPDAHTLFLTYNNGALSTEVDFNLAGGTVGSHQSGMGESLTLINHTASPMDLHFFQYADFDLGGVTGGQTSQLSKNLGGLFNDAFQSGAGVTVSETAVVPGANHGEANLFNATLVKLNDANPTTLNDVANSGSGDATWALEWDLSLGAGQSQLISKTLSIVPEPGVLALVSMGFVAFAFRKRS
jgi:hypothetical protein